MTRRRVLLMTPPLPTSARDLKRSAINLGLWYLGSSLEQAGYAVKILDVALEGWNHLRFQSGPITEYGLSDEAIATAIEKFAPEIIGLNLSPTVIYPAVLATAKMIKSRFPNIMMVVGGTHATALPEKTLRDAEGAIDFAVIGEGEVVMKKIMAARGDQNKIKKLKGVAYLEGDEFKMNPRESFLTNLDYFGPLDFSLIRHIPVTKDPTYAGPAYGRKYVDVVFSRGCPLNCGYCFSPQMWQRVFRTHSLDWISQQLDLFKNEGIGHIVIQDENFTRGEKSWVAGMIDLFRKKEFTWDNTAGVEMETLTPEAINEMADSGCVNLFIPLNLRTGKTNIIPEGIRKHYLRVLEAARKRKIKVYTSNIIGFPEQTLQNIDRQAELAKSLVDQGLSYFHLVLAFSVLPGTGRWQQIMKPTGRGEYEVRKESGVVFEGGWQNWHRYSIYTPQIGSRNFSFSQLEKRYYDLIEYVNGKKKAKSWFEKREWPK